MRALASPATPPHLSCARNDVHLGRHARHRERHSTKNHFLELATLQQPVSKKKLEPTGNTSEGTGIMKWIERCAVRTRVFVWFGFVLLFVTKTPCGDLGLLPYPQTTTHIDVGRAPCFVHVSGVRVEQKAVRTFYFLTNDDANIVKVQWNSVAHLRGHEQRNSAANCLSCSEFFSVSLSVAECSDRVQSVQSDNA